VPSLLFAEPEGDRVVQIADPSDLEALHESDRRNIQKDQRLWSYHESSADGRDLAFSMSREYRRTVAR
jgi:hypothetical protein